MYQNIFDTHAHYDDERFDGDREALLDALPAKGVVAVVNAASDMKTSASGLALARAYDYFYCAAGVHPHEAGSFAPGDLDAIAGYARDPKVVAVGEIGLDYHYDFSPRDVQQQVFEAQLGLANDLGMPVIIHDREAHADTLALLRKYRPRGILHCFSGSAEMAGEILKLGMYLAFGGAVTFKNAKKPAEAAAAVPLDRLLVETDCPYMTPSPSAAGGATRRSFPTPPSGSPRSRGSPRRSCSTSPARTRAASTSSTDGGGRGEIPPPNGRNLTGPTHAGPDARAGETARNRVKNRDRTLPGGRGRAPARLRTLPRATIRLRVPCAKCYNQNIQGRSSIRQTKRLGVEL